MLPTTPLLTKALLSLAQRHCNSVSPSSGLTCLSQLVHAASTAPWLPSQLHTNPGLSFDASTSILRHIHTSHIASAQHIDDPLRIPPQYKSHPRLEWYVDPATIHHPPPATVLQMPEGYDVYNPAPEYTIEGQIEGQYKVKLQKVFAVVKVGNKQYKVCGGGGFGGVWGGGSGCDACGTCDMLFVYTFTQALEAITYTSYKSTHIIQSYACTSSKHTHIQVTPRDLLYIDPIQCDINTKLMLRQVLLLGSPTETVVGRPYIPEATVECIVEEQFLDAKVCVGGGNVGKGVWVCRWYVWLTWRYRWFFIIHNVNNAHASSACIRFLHPNHIPTHTTHNTQKLVFKKRRRKNSKRLKGFRHPLTAVRIVAIHDAGVLHDGTPQTQVQPQKGDKLMRRY